MDKQRGICRKRSSFAAAAEAAGGGGGSVGAAAGAAIAGAAREGRVSEGLSRGDLGAIGVSDAGDDLGVSSGSGGSSKVRCNTRRFKSRRKICSIDVTRSVCVVTVSVTG